MKVEWSWIRLQHGLDEDESWEVGGADLARRPPERAPEAQARLWSCSAVAWGRYSGWWRGLGDENRRRIEGGNDDGADV